MDEPEGSFTWEVPGEDPAVVGIVSLAQICAVRADDAWPVLISEHFSNLFEPGSLLLRRGEAPTLTNMRIRIYPEDAVEGHDPADIVHRPLSGLLAMLVKDSTTTTRTVARAELKAANLNEEQAWLAALENVANEAVTRHRETLPDGASFDDLAGDSYYVATNLLLVDRLTGLDSEGCIAAVPNRHRFLFHAIRSRARAQVAADALATVAVALFREGPGSISPHLYWVKNDTIEKQLVTLDEKTRVPILSRATPLAAFLGSPGGVHAD